MKITLPEMRHHRRHIFTLAIPKWAESMFKTSNAKEDEGKKNIF